MRNTGMFAGIGLFFRGLNSVYPKITKTRKNVTPASCQFSIMRAARPSIVQLSNPLARKPWGTAGLNRQPNKVRPAQQIAVRFRAQISQIRAVVRERMSSGMALHQRLSGVLNEDLVQRG